MSSKARSDGVFFAGSAERPEAARAGAAAARVVHAAVFGSVAPGEAIDTSDVDVLIDLDPEKGVGLFEYVDIVNRATLKPRLRSNILCEALGAF